MSTTPTAAPVSYTLTYYSGLDFTFPPQVSDSVEGTYYCVFPELTVEDELGGPPPKQIKMWTIGTGTLVTVSKDGGGNIANADCSEPAINANATKIAYISTATNLINNGSGLQRIFRTTKSGGVWTTTNDVFDGSTGACTYPTISADGSRVSYQADAALSQVWVWDSGLGTSFEPNAANTNGKVRPFMSSDGLVITYETSDLLGAMTSTNQLDTYTIMGSPVTVGNDGPYLYVQRVDNDNPTLPETYHFNSIVHLRSGEYGGLSADGESLVFDSSEDRILNGSSFPGINHIYLRTGASW